MFISIIHNSKKKEVTQMSISCWMDKQNVVFIYTHNGILFSSKKEGRSDTCYNVGEPWGHYCKWNKPDTQYKYVWFHLREGFIEAESRSCRAGCVEGRTGS